jgi:hypothetical protein
MTFVQPKDVAARAKPGHDESIVPLVGITIAVPALRYANAGYTFFFLAAPAAHH